MGGFNYGLPGNTAAEHLVGRSVDAQEAQYVALMAIAFELRTANILTLQSTPEWLNQARVRMGEKPVPPDQDFSIATAPAPDQRCEKLIIEGRDAGLRCWLKVHHDGECK